MKTYQLIALILTAGISANAFAGKPPPKPAKDLDCIGCVDTVDIAPQAVTTDKLSQDVQDTLQDANLNGTRITINSTDIQTNAINIGINDTAIQNNAANIQTNTSAIGNISIPKVVNVLVDGVRVGAYIGSENTALNISYYYTLLDSTYLAGVWGGADILQRFNTYYESADCTGQAYVNNDGFNDSTVKQGIVFTILKTASNDLLYVPKGTVLESVTPQSHYDHTCKPTSTTSLMYKAYPNDSNVTGVIPADFVGTVTLGY